MTTFEFVKMHGAGNDFVMIDDRAETFPLEKPDFIARLANRPTGMGCEGVILVRRSTVADFAMRFFNPDGSEADMCGNGARCVAAFARQIGAATRDEMTFETRAGLVSAQLLPDGRVTIGLPDPKDLRTDFVNSGVPHKIVAVEDLSAVDVDGQGRQIRYSAAFAPAGTNVDFVRYEAPSRAFIRTYERGVEGETFACGTGAVATALIGVAQYGLTFPVTVITARQVELTIDARYEAGRFTQVTLTGPVQVVYKGKWVNP